MNKNQFWMLLKSTFFVLCALAFSPWVLSPGEPTPDLLGIPRTLWAGIAVSGGFALLVILGAAFAPSADSSEKS